MTALNQDIAPTAPALTETPNCVACGSANFTQLTETLRDLDDYGRMLKEPYASLTFAFVTCNDCNTTYLRPRVRQEHIGHYYAGDYHCYKPFKERGAVFRLLSTLMARSKKKQIEGLFPDAQHRVLLDYGCGSGTWMELMQALNVDWKLIGTDIIDEAITRVKALGIEGHVTDERALAQYVKPGSVGVVHMFHVIEHVPEPVTVLKKLAETLAPGGCIIGQTPNIDSWDCRLFGKNWNQWHIPRHLVLYTPETLRRHAQLAGLEVVSITSAMASATNWAGSLMKWRALRSGSTYEPTHSPLYPLLTLAFIPVAIIQSLFSTTSSIDFVFRKPR